MPIFRRVQNLLLEIPENVDCSSPCGFCCHLGDLEKAQVYSRWTNKILHQESRLPFQHLGLKTFRLC